MNIADLKSSGRIILDAVGGSIAYGTSTPNSDRDIRGIYINPAREYMGLIEPSGQISDEKHDVTYYSLKRFFELAQKSNPNIIEMLWYPNDCINIMTPHMEKLIAHRDLFISKKCFGSHIGYANAQIKKAKGQNKKVHNPQPEEQPKKEDFCWVITPQEMYESDDGVYCPNAPFRPKPLMETEKTWPLFADLSEFHVAAVEHTQHMYRLYWYGAEAKGVFRGDNMLVCESIPKEDENRKFQGLLIYNQDSYEKALKDHKSYWDWKKNRNEHRWVDQEKGKLNYDQKNMLHCMRLLLSGESILKHGFPLVRFEGEQRDYLMKIRAGELEYEEIMAEVERRVEVLESLKDSSDIPNKVNVEAIEDLYRSITS